MSLIAQPGLGKTTLLFYLLQHLERYAKTVFLFQTLGGPEDLLRSLLRDLGIEAQYGDLAGMHAQLNDYLLMQTRQGRRLVVVIDEAQNLPDSALELLRCYRTLKIPAKNNADYPGGTTSTGGQTSVAKPGSAPAANLN